MTSRDELPRQTPTSDDPVADALSGAGELVSRQDDAVLDPVELRELIRVDAIDPAEWHGLNTQLVFAEGCAWYADLRDDGLTLALADQPGIEELDHVEREVVFVRTSLSLPDAHAAAIRALLEINRHPRPVPRPGLSMETLSGLATAAGPLLAEHGFNGRLRLGLDDGESSGVNGYYRTCEERLLQVVRFWNGIGGMPDGTLLEGTVSVWLNLVDIATLDPVESIILVRGTDFPQGVAVASSRIDAVPPDADVLIRALRDECLPWFDMVNSRAGIVRDWVRDPFGSEPPYSLWEKVEVAARWGMRDEASSLLRFGQAKQPYHESRFAAVAEKYQL